MDHIEEHRRKQHGQCIEAVLIRLVVGDVAVQTLGVFAQAEDDTKLVLKLLVSSMSFKVRGHAWAGPYRYQCQSRVQYVQQHQRLGLGLSPQPFTADEHSVDLDSETSEDEDEELLDPHPSHVDVKT